MRRVAVLVASLLMASFAVSAASAHAELESMTPAAGSTVSTAPAEVQLTFGEEVATLGSTIVVLDPNGNAMQSGEPVVDGVSISVALQPLTVAGTYHVNFRVVSADGHVVNDSKTFDFAPVDPAVGPTATPLVMTPSPETSVVTESDSTIAFWITGLLLVVGVLAALIAWRAKR